MTVCMCLLAQRDRCLSAWTIVSMAGAKPSPSASRIDGLVSRRARELCITPSARPRRAVRRRSRSKARRGGCWKRRASANWERSGQSAPMADSTRAMAGRSSSASSCRSGASGFSQRLRRTTFERIAVPSLNAVRQRLDPYPGHREAGLRFWILHGEKVADPADEVAPSSIATSSRETVRFRRPKSA